MNRLHWIDRLSGKSVSSMLAHYRETEAFPAEVMARYQAQKLRAMAHHAVDHVPFYREAFRAAGLAPEDCVNTEVLRVLPVIDKELVRSRYEEFLPENLDRMSGLRMLKTGGTTGAPLRFPVDPQRRSSVWAAMYRYYGWMGVEVGDPMLVLWGAPVVRSGWTGLRRRVLDTVRRRLENQVWLDSFELSASRVESIARVFLQHHPVMVRGYCQTLYELARLFKEDGFRYPLRAVSTTVEPLFASYRATFRDVFACETFDQYGCGEIESIAFECEAHAGLHIAEERCIVETDAADRVILTELDNRAFPLFRYMPGDQVELAPPGRCSCGRESQRIIRVLGRTGDVVLTPGGGRLHPEFFTHLLNETGISFARQLTRYQVVQTSETSLEWNLECVGLTEEDEAALGAHLQRYLDGMQWRIRRVDEIPVSLSGKFRYVRSMLSSEDRPDGET